MVIVGVPLSRLPSVSTPRRVCRSNEESCEQQGRYQDALNLVPPVPVAESAFSAPTYTGKTLRGQSADDARGTPVTSFVATSVGFSGMAGTVFARRRRR